MARTFILNGDYVYFCVPQWTSEQDVHLPKSHCKVIKLNYTECYYADMSLLGDKLVRTFNRKVSSSLIDAVITSKPFLIPYLSVGLSDIAKDYVPIVYFEPGVADKFERLKKTNASVNIGQMVVAMGYVQSKTIFLTDVERMLAKRFVSEFLASSIVDKFFHERSVVLPVGVPIDVLDTYKKLSKNETFTLFFGGRVNDVKRAEDIVALYDKFYSSGRKVRIIVCTSTPDMLAKRYIGKERFVNNKQIELYCNMPRNEYLKLAAQSHVFVAWSRREGFPVAFWEQLYLDLVGVYVDEDWVDAQVPSDYPYRFKNFNEAYANLALIYDDYEGSKKRIAYLKEKVKDFNKDIIYKQVRDVTFDLFKSNKWRATRGVKELIKECLIEFKWHAFFIDDLLLLMEKKGRNFTPKVSDRAKTYRFPTNYDIYRYLLELGYECELRFDTDIDRALFYL